MANDIESQIRSRIEAFTEELASLVKLAALESVNEALGGAAPARRPGRPRKTSGRKTKSVRRAKAGRPKATKARKAKGGKRIRRSPEQLEAMAETVLTHVRANPGDRLEQISAKLRIPSKELKRPVAALLDAKKLRTTGQRRGTKYFTAGRGGKKSAKKKA